MNDFVNYIYLGLDYKRAPKTFHYIKRIITYIKACVYL